MQDTPNSIIKYDGDKNTVIKINQGNVYSQNTPWQNYPKQIKFQDINYKTMGYFNRSGLNLLDVNGNYNNFNAYFTQTGTNLLLCSIIKLLLMQAKFLNVFEMTTYSVYGIPTGTPNRWNVASSC